MQMPYQLSPMGHPLASDSLRNRLRYSTWANLSSGNYRTASLGGRIDLLISRTYFMRLWVIKEIVLSSNAVVVCGNYHIDWKSFRKAAQRV